MRRSSLAIILIALALVSRLLAPLAVEARGFDPLRDAPICTHDGGPSAGANRGDAPASVHAWCELTCCQIAPGLATAPPNDFVLHRTPIVLVWTRDDGASLARHAASAHRARGPPIS